MSCDDVMTLNDFRRIFGVNKMTISSTVRRGEGIDFNTSFGGLEFFRMEDIEDSARIMDWREGELVVIEIHYIKLLKHIIDCFGKMNLLIGFKVIDYLLSCHILVGDF